jgi:uncharacterized protein YjbI with pentapeptide repeats
MDTEHVDILRRGVDVWNQWRALHPEVLPDLGDAELGAVDLSGANFANARMSGASLRESLLVNANFCHAQLIGADFYEADLTGAKLAGASAMHARMIGASLTESDLRADFMYAMCFGSDFAFADLTEANFSGSDVSEASFFRACCKGTNFESARCVKTDFEKANLTGARVYGISAWDLTLKETTQNALVITPCDQSTITVDDLEMAQFIYLLLTNAKIRRIIDTIMSKVVLILGRFTRERKLLLDAIREEIRKRGYLPILFDFDKPTARGPHG